MPTQFKSPKNSHRQFAAGQIKFDKIASAPFLRQKWIPMVLLLCVCAVSKNGMYFEKRKFSIDVFDGRETHAMSYVVFFSALIQNFDVFHRSRTSMQNILININEFPYIRIIIHYWIFGYLVRAGGRSWDATHKIYQVYQIVRKLFWCNVDAMCVVRMKARVCLCMCLCTDTEFTVNIMIIISDNFASDEASGSVEFVRMSRLQCAPRFES